MIDAHQHVWQIGRNGCTWPTEAEGAIHRDFGLDDLRAVALPAGIRRTVLVQSQEDDRDTDWLLDLAERETIAGGVVGWTDLAAADVADRLAALASRPKLVGLRPMVQDRAADWYDDPALEAGWAAMIALGLRLDALVRVRHLAALGRLADRHSELGIVIDHAAKPRIGERSGFASWLAAIAPLADRPNVWCKLSGLLTECAGRPPDAVEPYVDALLELFGPGRLMWGSDWPVLERAGRYAEWLEIARRLVPASARAAVFEGTAARFYGIEVEA